MFYFVCKQNFFFLLFLVTFQLVLGSLHDLLDILFVGDVVQRSLLHDRPPLFGRLGGHVGRSLLVIVLQQFLDVLCTRSY